MNVVSIEDVDDTVGVEDEALKVDVIGFESVFCGSVFVGASEAPSPREKVIVFEPNAVEVEDEMGCVTVLRRPEGAEAVCQPERLACCHCC